jgi:hypothetical protein
VDEMGSFFRMRSLRLPSHAEKTLKKARRQYDGFESDAMKTTAPEARKDRQLILRLTALEETLAGRRS